MERLKYLFKAYGWYALGVYAVLTILDFGVAFAAIYLAGAEHVSRLTAYVKESALNIFGTKPPERALEDSNSDPSASGGQESLYAMLLLAYTIHKTLFLPLRVGLTAALTPPLVGWLRRRGWAGGAGTLRAAAEMRNHLKNRKNKSARDDDARL